MNWKKISIFLLFVIAFLGGFLRSDFNVGVWIACTVLIVLIVGYGKISKVVKENGGIRFVAVAIAMVLVLIPLIVFGTCLMTVGGSSFKSLFIR